jgi:hypothetical protein
MSWQDLSYRMKGLIIGSIVSVLLFFVYTIYSGVFLLAINIETTLTALVCLLAPLPVLFGLFGSILDFKKNRKALPIIIFSLLTLGIVAVWVSLYLFIEGTIIN